MCFFAGNFKAVGRKIVNFGTRVQDKKETYTDMTVKSSMLICLLFDVRFKRCHQIV